ncbi:MAG TPA: hypothetical protein VFX60_17185 [Micromonospora sp.]|nr:hypothetical protein [Micromonospora sp.]
MAVEQFFADLTHFGPGADSGQGFRDQVDGLARALAVGAGRDEQEQPLGRV